MTKKKPHFMNEKQQINSHRELRNDRERRLIKVKSVSCARSVDSLPHTMYCSPISYMLPGPTTLCIRFFTVANWGDKAKAKSKARRNTTRSPSSVFTLGDGKIIFLREKWVFIVFVLDCYGQFDGFTALTGDYVMNGRVWRLMLILRKWVGWRGYETVRKRVWVALSEVKRVFTAINYRENLRQASSLAAKEL